MDYKTGSILDALDDLKIREDTIVIWTSDNGADFSKAPDTVGSAGFWRGKIGSGSGFTTCKDPKEEIGHASVAPVGGFPQETSAGSIAVPSASGAK